MKKLNQIKKMAVVLLAVLAVCGSVSAQSTMRNTPVFDAGDLVVSSTGRMFDGELSKAAEPYSENIVGVFSATTPAMNVPAVLENGIAYVKFDTQNGHVQKGEYITSSANPGFGMKALQSGFVAGVALEDSQNSSNGLVKIRVQVGWVRL